MSVYTLRQKFRAWDTQEKVMIKNPVTVLRLMIENAFKSSSRYIFDQRVMIISENTINTHDVFENDIIQACGEKRISVPGFCSPEDWTMEGPIIFKDGGWWFDHEGCLLSLPDLMNADPLITVIGNIHKNPELLEAGDE